MKIKNFENIYTNCCVNRYEKCLDIIELNNEEILLIYGSFNIIIIYSLKSNRIIERIKKHQSKINTIKCINNQYVMTSSNNNECFIWKLTSGNLELLHQLNHEDQIINCIDTNLIDQNFFTITSTTNQKLFIWKNNEIIKINDNDYKAFIFDIKIVKNFFNLKNKFLFLLANSLYQIDICCFDFDDNSVVKFTTLTGHDDWVKSVDCIEFDEKIWLASASQDSTIRVYEIYKNVQNNNKTSENFFTIKNDQDQDEEFIIKLDSILCGHENWINMIRWIKNIDSDNDNNRLLNLLSCSSDKTIILWEKRFENSNVDNIDIWNEKYRFGELGGQECLLFESFLSCFYCSTMKILISHSYYGSIHLWKFNANENNKWECLPSITGHFDTITDLCWEPMGEYFLTCSNDQTTRLHSIWKNNNESWHEISRPQIHGYNIKTIKFFKRNSFISGSDEKLIRIFRSTKLFNENLKNISNINLEDQDVLDQDDEKIANYATTSSLGLTNSLIYNNQDDDLKNFIIKKPPNEEYLIQNTLWMELKKLYGHGNEIFIIELNHSRTILASASKATTANDAKILLWNLQTYKKIDELLSHTLTVTQLSFSYNDKYLLSVSRDRQWTLFDLSTSPTNKIYKFNDKKIHTRIIWDCSWTSDSRNFFTASRDKTIIRWSINQDVDDELKIEMKEKISFDYPITTIDVHRNIFKNNENEEKYLIGIGLENGDLLLYSIINLDDGGSNWISLINLNNHHTSIINRLRFSSKFDEQDENCCTIYLATCGQDQMIQLLKICLEF